MYKTGKANKVADMLNRLPIDDSFPSNTHCESINLIDSVELNLFFENLKKCTNFFAKLKINAVC